MMGKIECQRRGWLKMRQLDSITDSMEMNLGMLQSMGSRRIGHNLVTEQHFSTSLDQTPDNPSVQFEEPHLASTIEQDSGVQNFSAMHTGLSKYFIALFFIPVFFVCLFECEELFTGQMSSQICPLLPERQQLLQQLFAY